MSRSTRSGAARRSRSVWGTVGKVFVSSVTAILLLAVFGLLAVLTPADHLIDGSDARSGSHTVSVGQTMLQSYCPARMQLADTESYGDSAYQISEGNIVGKARFAAFGSMYSTAVTSLNGDDKHDTPDIDLTDQTKAFVYGSDAGADPLLLTSRMLDVSKGSGVAASVASWATEGDLQGLSSVQCVNPQLRQSFLLPATQTGWTQQLVLANPTEKSTTVSMSMWGTGSAQAIASSTDSKVTVAGKSQTVVDVSAAAPAQDGLYLSLTSSGAPVSAVVRVVHAEGLAPRGSDYATPLPATAATDTTIAGVGGGQDVTVNLYSDQGGDVTLSWITGSGTSEAKKDTVTANTVKSIGFGKAPDDALGLRVESGSAVYVSAICSQSSDNQTDFSLANGVVAVASGAVAIPDGVDATLAMVNTADQTVTTKLIGYGDDGTQKGEKEVTVEPHKAVSIKPSEIADGVVTVTMSDDKASIVWSAMIGVNAVNDAHLAGLGVIGSSSLMPAQAQVRADQSLSVVK
ncbi:hypothetical protein BTIS_1230 [Bifidobacterium tissieri]|uniref:Organic solvents resistance ABC transporter permease n=1 Tax=Bifidobacterium tissieri TaxID=1630162 RepID=A0A261FFR9_9BIFI|nr:DUF5719 family protein [Bifidobacterium tissieri]OZG57989.1 hypothetical protein BTIS_1230 [Bifidobacterium tissieri]